jgi:outer membrane immunogenic protein
MSKLVLGSIAGLIIAVTVPANAADMPLKAPPQPVTADYNWAGFYVGVSGGYGWSQGGDIGLASVGIPAPASLPVIATGAASAIPTGLGTQANGFIGGAEIGYNYQWHQWVWGIEADLSGANIRGSAAQNATSIITTIVSFPANGSAVGEQKLDLFGTVRGRLGLVAADRLLIFATGGLAYGHAESNTSTGDIPDQVTIGPALGSASRMLAGWTVGGGFEWAFAPRWSFKTEYLYYDLGSLNYALSPNVVTSCCTAVEGSVNTAASAMFRGSIARVGIDYKL